MRTIGSILIGSALIVIKETEGRVPKSNALAESSPSIRYVKQIENSGCAIACTAMILGLSYHQTLDLFIKDDPNFLSREPSRSNRGAWFGPNHSSSLERVSRIIKTNGFRVRKTTKLNSETKNPILFKFAWDPGYPLTTHHCSIVYDGQIYCPSAGVRSYLYMNSYVENFKQGVDEPALLISRR